MEPGGSGWLLFACLLVPFHSLSPWMQLTALIRKMRAFGSALPDNLSLMQSNCQCSR
ncbi:uncharacterized protein BP01DRAFT_357297 [Aspergillus saccharolyticus JOP 1030-1]|uniref:Uncharacterized protein n=1 Tax=Aspergillus saccharolyticus JOP 1030-1 TaxID=1450539 RepID=A0A318ZC12_9EURO|nr:hypothetical protein BP01DRAFT_357297 [Aspergillus saccharolyticus JOP 1030-1]PYH44946.1 hypothetical protein BP01DRAFT_357297 [Aspergillus saccharolyticus JOP 1030-1]